MIKQVCSFFSQFHHSRRSTDQETQRGLWMSLWQWVQETIKAKQLFIKSKNKNEVFAMITKEDDASLAIVVSTFTNNYILFFILLFLWYLIISFFDHLFCFDSFKYISILFVKSLFEYLSNDCFFLLPSWNNQPQQSIKRNRQKKSNNRDSFRLFSIHSFTWNFSVFFQKLFFHPFHPFSLSLSLYLFISDP